MKNLNQSQKPYIFLSILLLAALFFTGCAALKEAQQKREEKVKREMQARYRTFERPSSTTDTQQPSTTVDTKFSVGQPALPFTKTAVSGRSIAFPDDFKGKIVLLDFWATWCGPCIGELPNLKRVYKAYHAQGFDILGISLDQPDTLEKLKQFLVDNEMPWEQIYDGKGWSAEIAQMYNIHSIPATFLVDGTTGRILALDLRGEALEAAVKRTLSEIQTAAYFDMGVIYAKQKDYDNARMNYELALQNTNDRDLQAEIQTTIGRTYYDQQDYKNAIVAYNKLIEEYPTSKYIAEAKLGIADSHFKLKDWSEASAAYQRLLDEHANQTDFIPYATYQIG